MPPKNNYDDESLARALQIEYEREYRRRSMNQHLDANGFPTNPTTGNSSASNRNMNNVPTRTPLPPPPIINPSAPLSSSFYNDDDANNDLLLNAVGSHRGTPQSITTLPRSSFVMAEDRFGGVEISDEAYARKLEREMMEEERRRNQRKQHLQQQRDSFRASNGSTNRGSNVTRQDEFPIEAHSRNNTSHISPSSNRRDTRHTDVNHSSHKSNNRSNNMPRLPAYTGTAMLYTDEELAMRLEQEMRDEELARQAFVEEQIRQSSIAAQSMHNTTNRRGLQRSGGSCCCRLIKCIILLAIAAATALLLLFFVFNPDEVGNFIPTADNFRDEDPFNSANTEDANLWRTGGNKKGLELVVVNALDDIWHPYFFTAIEQWNSGEPDTLTLSVEDGSPDSTCNAIDSKLKVCNGNYGATNWRGINKILLENGWIYSSAARMNEYYVTDNDSSQRQYTMCHEIGHGFGLPHTDENFFNKDLGNCMDYTNNPEVNMQPEYANFKFLAELYGTLDGSPVPTDDAATVESAANNTDSSVEEKKGHRRMLPIHVAKKLAEIDAIVDMGTYRSEAHGWRILHESPYGHAHEFDLGDGYSVQIHALNA